MKLDFSKATVSKFEAVPARTRPAGAGAKSPLLEGVRKLAVKEKLSVTIPTDASLEEVSDLVKATGQALTRRGALGFRPRVVVNKVDKTLEIYRDTNSEWAMKGEDFVLSDTGR